MPPASRGSCEGLHSGLWLWEILSGLAGSERGGYNPLSEFALLSDRHPDPANFAKSFEVSPLQADLEQQLLHLLQVLHKTIEWHKKHLSHILICDLFDNNKLLTRDLFLSFGNGWAQNVQLLQHDILQFIVCSCNGIWLPASSLSCNLSTKQLSFVGLLALGWSWRVVLGFAFCLSCSVQGSQYSSRLVDLISYYLSTCLDAHMDGNDLSFLGEVDPCFQSSQCPVPPVWEHHQGTKWEYAGVPSSRQPKYLWFNTCLEMWQIRVSSS